MSTEIGPIPAKSNPPWRKMALWAVVTFLLLNLVLSAADKGVMFGEKPGGVLYQACDSALREFQRGKPGVVLMGSSLVMAPVWSSDSKHYRGVGDFYHHHKSLLLKDALKDQGIDAPRVTSMALPGAMVSDAYLLADKLFKGDRKPELIVYGLAPRDFMDDLLTGETRTVVFQELMDMSDLPALGNLYLPSWQEKTDFALNNVFFLYGKRWRYQDKVLGVYNRLLEKVSKTAHAKDTSGVQGFLMSTNRQETWEKSVKEYRARYEHFNLQQFEKQELFLNLLVKVAQQRSIPIILVNMPLTKKNIELMNPTFYRRYRETICSIAQQYHCPLIDMQSDSRYSVDDFYDTVHLNASGGEKLLQSLARGVADYEHRELAQRRTGID